MKLVLAVVGAVVLAVIGGAAALPDHLHVERSLVIAAPAAEIQPLLAEFPQRASWIAWVETDPTATYAYTGEPGAIGSTMAWTGPSVGEAQLTLVSVDPGREVVTRMDYRAPLAMTTTDRFVLEPVAGGTRVRWVNDGPLPFGPARVFAVFADGLLGPDYERGLQKLSDLFPTH